MMGGGGFYEVTGKHKLGKTRNRKPHSAFLPSANVFHHWPAIEETLSNLSSSRCTKNCCAFESLTGESESNQILKIPIYIFYLEHNESWFRVDIQESFEKKGSTVCMFLKEAFDPTAISNRQQDRTDRQQDFYNGYMQIVVYSKPILCDGNWYQWNKLHLRAAALVLTSETQHPWPIRP